MSQTSSKLYKEYKRLADRADKRLLRLERLEKEHPDLYKNVTSFAYAKAERAIEHWDGKKFDKPRFARKTPATDEELAMKIKDIQEFLDMTTSTKKGVDTVYKKRADTLNKKYSELFEMEIKFTWQEWARFGIRGHWDRTDNQFTYNEMIKVAALQKKKEDMIAAYHKYRTAFNTGKGSVKPIRYNAKIKGPDILSELKKELGVENLLRSDMNLIEDTINTIFERDKGIVLKETEKNLADNNLSYDSMFKS